MDLLAIGWTLSDKLANIGIGSSRAKDSAQTGEHSLMTKVGLGPTKFTTRFSWRFKRSCPIMTSQHSLFIIKSFALLKVWPLMSSSTSDVPYVAAVKDSEAKVNFLSLGTVKVKVINSTYM